MKAIGSRITIDLSVVGMEVQIRAPCSWFVLVFLTIWLAVWMFGTANAIAEFMRQRHSFVGFWLIGWALGGAFGLLTWSWMAVGREVLTVGAGGIIVSKRVGPFGRAQHYVLDDCSDVRVSGPFGSPIFFIEQTRFWGLTGGTVAFDYRGKTIRFGIGLSEEDARELAAELVPYVREAA